MAACDRQLFEAYVYWWSMHAEMEGMPIESWRALAKGQPEAAKIPEVARSIELLRRAAGAFRAGAEGSRELVSNAAVLGQPIDKKIQESIKKNVTAYKALAAKIDDMASMLERGEAPSLAQVQGIEKAMLAQHTIADERARQIGALDALKRG